MAEVMDVITAADGTMEAIIAATEATIVTVQAPLSQARLSAVLSAGAAAMATRAPTINAMATITGRTMLLGAITDRTIMAAIRVGITVTPTGPTMIDIATDTPTTEPVILSISPAIGMGVRQKWAAPCATIGMATDMWSLAAGI